MKDYRIHALEALGREKLQKICSNKWIEKGVLLISGSFLLLLFFVFAFHLCGLAIAALSAALIADKVFGLRVAHPVL